MLLFFAEPNGTRQDDGRLLRFLLMIQLHHGGMRSQKRQVQREVRRSRNIRATLKHPGSADRPCVVSDISSDGAKIIVEGSGNIPARFELEFNHGGTRRLCDLIWWDGKSAGIKFV